MRRKVARHPLEEIMSAGSQASNRRAAIVGSAIAVAILLLLILFVTSGARPPGTSQPNTRSDDSGETSKLTFVLYGSCSSEGGTIAGVGTGFTPDGGYVTQVFRVLNDRPDIPYTKAFNNIGHADSTGRIMNWSWPCAGDTPGNYRVIITDLGTVTADHPFADDIGRGFVILKPSS